MADRIRLTILGSASSPGVPRINGDWGNCDPANPKNRRRRPAAMVERIAQSGGVTRAVIDTGPDFREQMLSAGVFSLDAVLYTHPHADHIHGIDDLRGFALQQRELVDVYADKPTMDRLFQGFSYCFRTPEGGSYPPILRANLINHDECVDIDGEGGTLRIEPLRQIHGGIISLGFRVGGIAYCPDISDFPVGTVERLAHLDHLVIDALQYRRHPSHLSLDEALRWIAELAPDHAVLTHMHISLDYETVMRKTPDNVEPGYDGMILEIDL